MVSKEPEERLPGHIGDGHLRIILRCSRVRIAGTISKLTPNEELGNEREWASVVDRVPAGPSFSAIPTSPYRLVEELRTQGRFCEAINPGR